MFGNTTSNKHAHCQSLNTNSAIKLLKLEKAEADQQVCQLLNRCSISAPLRLSWSQSDHLTTSLRTEGAAGLFHMEEAAFVFALTFPSNYMPTGGNLVLRMLSVPLCPGLSPRCLFTASLPLLMHSKGSCFNVTPSSTNPALREFGSCEGWTKMRHPSRIVSKEDVLLFWSPNVWRNMSGATDRELTSNKCWHFPLLQVPAWFRIKDKFGEKNIECGHKETREAFDW